ncbi:MAG: hypothetical protein AAFU55_17525, partial [Pseudomonadota bacterium]
MTEARNSEPGGRAAKRRASARLSPVRRCLAFAAAIASAAFALVLIVGVGVYARLAAGPIDLNDYLADISAQISERLPGAHLDIAGAAIALDDTGSANL